MDQQLNRIETAVDREEALPPFDIAGGDRPSFEALASAKATIRALGPKSNRAVPPMALVQIGEWLGWPAWFKTDTALATGPGLPSRISVAEDLTIIANVVDYGAAVPMLSRLAGNMRIAGSQVVAPALYNAPGLLDALMLAKRSTEACNPYIRMMFETSEDNFLFVIDSDIEEGSLRRFVSAVCICTLKRFIEFFCPESVDDIRIGLRASRNDAVSKFIDSMPGKKAFDLDSYSIGGGASWLRVENSQADPAFWNLALERVGQIERERIQSDIVDRIRILIREMMETEGRVPRLKQIAAQEGVSERTLMRTLAALGTNFHKIVEAERRLRSAELIGNASVSLSEIARSLGFTDMSSFGRSYRKWFGMTPGQARYWRTNCMSGQRAQHLQQADGANVRS